MPQEIYTVATDELRILDRSKLMTLESAERVRDSMQEVFGRTFYVVNIVTYDEEVGEEE